MFGCRYFLSYLSRPLVSQSCLPLASSIPKQSVLEGAKEVPPEDLGRSERRNAAHGRRHPSVRRIARRPPPPPLVLHSSASVARCVRLSHPMARPLVRPFGRLGVRPFVRAFLSLSQCVRVSVHVCVCVCAPSPIDRTHTRRRANRAAEKSSLGYGRVLSRIAIAFLQPLRLQDSLFSSRRRHRAALLHRQTRRSRRMSERTSGQKQNADNAIAPQKRGGTLLFSNVCVSLCWLVSLLLCVALLLNSCDICESGEIVAALREGEGARAHFVKIIVNSSHLTE